MKKVFTIFEIKSIFVDEECIEILKEWNSFDSEEECLQNIEKSLKESRSGVRLTIVIEFRNF